nr:DUF4185 domain-containing protein [Streptomyces piniterrae]
MPPDHPGGPERYTTVLPSDVFIIGDSMYLHLMRGPIYDTHHTDLWRSTDDGETWEYLCEWDRGLYEGQFQQKTYAVADDGFCYVLSSELNRRQVSGLLLHRVGHDQVGDPAAYEPWGVRRRQLGLGQSADRRRQAPYLGRDLPARDGRRVRLHLAGHGAGAAEPAGDQGQVFPLPTSDLFTTPEQTLIVNGPPDQQGGLLVTSPYGGFIIPGSTLDNFHIAVSQWYDDKNYRVMQYRGSVDAPAGC